MPLNLSDTTPAVWVPETGRIYTWLNAAGRCIFSGDTIEEIRAKHYGSAQVIPMAEAETLAAQAARLRHCTGPQPISEERYEEALNCLPPEKWGRCLGVESFRLSERLDGEIATFFLRAGGRCWVLNEHESTSGEELARLLAPYLI